MPTSLAAQTMAPAEATGLVGGNEIIVTARKREESLQDVPLSITALSSEELSRSGSRSLEDIVRQAPGVQFNTSLSGTRPGRLYSIIRFRGISGSEYSTSTSETASVFVDGIYALQGGNSVALMDLERVEVIKGPQAAQFGRNSFAGAINYITTKPSLVETKIKGEAEASTYSSYQVQASVSVPIVRDKLAFRLSARSNHKGSMYTATDGGELGKQTTNSVSADLYAEPTEQFTLRLRGYYQHDDDGPNAQAFLNGAAYDTCSGTSRPGYATDGTPTTIRPTLFICGAIPNPGQAGSPKVTTNTSIMPGILQSSQGTRIPVPNLIVNLINNPGISNVPKLDGMGLKRDVWRSSLAGTYEFDNDISISMTASYNDNRANILRDFDDSDVENIYTINPYKGRDYGFDARVESPGKGRFRWLVGGNYYNQKYETSLGGGISAVTCLNGCLNGSSIALNNGLDGTDNVKTYGAYGSASFDVFSTLTLDLEARYQVERHQSTVFSQEFKQFLPRASLSFKPSRDLTVYATFAQGKLPGNINTNYLTCNATPFTVSFTDPRTGLPSKSSVCQQFVDAVPDIKQYTDEQTLNSFEIGVKSSLFDRRLTLNLAGYYQKWKNDPFTTFVQIVTPTATGAPSTTPTFRPVATQGDVKSYGIEAQIAATPLPGWSLDWSGQWNKNEFLKYGVNLNSLAVVLGTRNLKGNRADRFPEWSFTGSSTYTFALTEEYDMYARADVRWQGKAFAGVSNLAYTAPYAIVNTTLGVQKGNMRIEGFVRNLFNQSNWAAAVEFPNYAALGKISGTDVGVILVPQDKRTFGVRTSFEF